MSNTPHVKGGQKSEHVGVEAQGPDAPKAADQTGPATLRSADANGGAPIRPDQAGTRLPPVPATGPGEGQRRVVADLHRSQPAQTVPLWGGSASLNTDQQVCRKCPEHRQGGRHSNAYETIGPSVAAHGDNSCRHLTSAVPKARQPILRRAARSTVNPESAAAATKTGATAYHASRSIPLNDTYLTISAAVWPPTASIDTTGTNPTTSHATRGRMILPLRVSKRLAYEATLVSDGITATARVVGNS